MAEYLIQSESLTTLADAIRSQTGETGNLTLNAMAESISNISGTNFSIVGDTEQPKTGDTLYWDGNTDGLDNLLDWYKVSDIVPSFEEFANGYILLLSNGSVNTENNISPVQETGFISVCENLCLVIEEDNLSMPAGTFSSKGIYFYKDTNYFTASLKIKGFTGFEKENVKENTIWVNTDVDIPSWTFSATQPETSEEGTIWISTGKSSTAPFNALKKNNITIYPIAAKQYVSGAWVDKTVQIYQNGAWADWWDGQLYENGNQFISITSGWGTHNYITDSRPLMAAEHKSDQMFFQAQNNYKVLMGIGNPVDLSDVNQIRVTGKINKVFPYNGATYGLHMDVLKTKDLESKVARRSLLVEEVFDYTLDVSSLSGEHYVIIWADSNANIQGYITGVYLN